MKREALRALIREEIANIRKEVELPPAPGAEEVGQEEQPQRRGSYDVTSKYIEKPMYIAKESDNHVFQPKAGDEIEFNIEDVKDTEGTIEGYSKNGDTLYINTRSGHYVQINLITESALIKKIVLGSGTTIVPPVTV